MFLSSAVKLQRNIKFPIWELAVSVTHRFQSSFSISKIKPCAIRKVLHCRKYQNHHSVIYGTVKHIHGYVVFFPVPSALPQNSKTDKVLLWTGLRRTKSERKTLSSKSTLVGEDSSPHRKPISRIYGGILYEIEFEK
jgi:hypothetical protein